MRQKDDAPRPLIDQSGEGNTDGVDGRGRSLLLHHLLDHRQDLIGQRAPTCERRIRVRLAAEGQHLACGINRAETDVVRTQIHAE